nr:MAG: DNA polymerase processivity subunit [Turdid alphaherpesvirus 1]
MRALRTLVSGAVVVVHKTVMLIHCATEKGLVYVELGWALFDEYNFRPGYGDDPIIFNVVSPQTGFLLDFLCDASKKAAQDPVRSARFQVTDSDDPAETRLIMKVTVTRDSGEVSTKLKYSSQAEDKIFVPLKDATCQVALEPYAHTEITKWLNGRPKGSGVKVTISDASLELRGLGGANGACGDEGGEGSDSPTAESVAFNTQWLDLPGDRVTSCDILAKLSGVGPDPGKRSVSARTVLKKLKEKRVVAVHRGPDWRREESGWPEVVRIGSAASLKKALQWLKIGAWGVPNLVFYKDEIRGLGVELSARGEEDLKACILFFSEQDCDDDGDDDMDVEAIIAGIDVTETREPSQKRPRLSCGAEDPAISPSATGGAAEMADDDDDDDDYYHRPTEMVVGSPGSPQRQPHHPQPHHHHHQQQQPQKRNQAPQNNSGKLKRPAEPVCGGNPSKGGQASHSSSSHSHAKKPHHPQPHHHHHQQQQPQKRNQAPQNNSGKLKRPAEPVCGGNPSKGGQASHSSSSHSHAKKPRVNKQ